MVDETIWEGLAEWLGNGHGALLGLWGDAEAVHMALLDAPEGVSVASIACRPGQFFPSVGALHPPAIRFERAVCDLSGQIPFDAPDDRPWLDHTQAYAFLPSEGEGLHQIPVGPVHAGIIEPGHFRFTCNGETIVRLEARLGYVHKGVEALMTGARLDRAAQLAARCSGDSTVAYSIAFARAVEAAGGVEIPERAHGLRGLMAELERLANHLGDIGAICNDAAFALMLAHCSVLRERVLRACAACFGHRLMMDGVAPGGVCVDLDGAATRRLQELVATIRTAFPPLVELYDSTTSLQDRTVATGILRPELAKKFGAGGFVGRASGRDFDARRALPYPPYDRLRFSTPVLTEGDVNARVWIRIREVEQSLALIAQILERLPPGEIFVEPGAITGEGLALVEGFRGDVLVWVRVNNGVVERCHLRDPSWLQWPLLEAAIEGNIVADFPLCNKSFNCSYSGHDL
ncbi:hydrogenase expression protein HypE [Rhodoblastus acidophilus]|uniref:Hydrogenase expression protein HypE n=2 Tax=Rhodoblastus acidophilus TaxID=1074 RepID=A0A6N8DLF3_RHOAC|nr:hydrogenase expression protein HypE [Rhodoblastus acidophilus]MTV31178.1 hydrogenase expression protein HypE [Rhodoblastus acidophilus]